MAVSVLKQDPNTKRFKGTLIYFDTDTLCIRNTFWCLDLTWWKFHSQQLYLHSTLPPQKSGGKKEKKEEEETVTTKETQQTNQEWFMRTRSTNYSTDSYLKQEKNVLLSNVSETSKICLVQKNCWRICSRYGFPHPICPFPRESGGPVLFLFNTQINCPFFKISVIKGYWKS